jgi:hypothetical protein
MDELGFSKNGWIIGLAEWTGPPQPELGFSKNAEESNKNWDLTNQKREKLGFIQPKPSKT